MKFIWPARATTGTNIGMEEMREVTVPVGANILGMQRGGERPEFIQLDYLDLLALLEADPPSKSTQYLKALAQSLKFKKK